MSIRELSLVVGLVLMVITASTGVTAFTGSGEAAGFAYGLMTGDKKDAAVVSAGVAAGVFVGTTVIGAAAGALATGGPGLIGGAAAGAKAGAIVGPAAGA